jgi:hypothetical protein
MAKYIWFENNVELFQHFCIKTIQSYFQILFIWQWYTVIFLLPNISSDDEFKGTLSPKI